MTDRSSLDLLQGTLDLLILRTLQSEPRHGWAIAERIQRLSQDVLQVNQGSLYPALHRLEQQGLIASQWGASENNRQAKFYELTRAGRRQLTEETKNWERLAQAVAEVAQLPGDVPVMLAGQLRRLHRLVTFAMRPVTRAADRIPARARFGIAGRQPFRVRDRIGLRAMVTKPNELVRRTDR